VMSAKELWLLKHDGHVENHMKTWSTSLCFAACALRHDAFEEQEFTSGASTPSAAVLQCEVHGTL